VKRLLKDPPSLLAIASNCAGVGNMQIVMVLTSLVLLHHGHSLSWIAFCHMLHALGMFGFTIPLGWVADRHGRIRVMLPGVAVALVGAALVTFTEGYWLITLGAFLVGLGWAAANVAATALIADRAATAHRGRAIGVGESLGGAASVLMALVTGPLIEYFGPPAAGVLAILVSLAPLPVLVAMLLRRRSPRRAAAGAVRRDQPPL
jgi:MFS family permease